MDQFLKWLRRAYHRSIHSIGFYPGLIALLFLAVFVLIFQLEESYISREIKQKFIWLNLRNGDAARTIITTIATSIIGLMVFSFSMVMVVMGQAASQMSNRVLDNLIGNKIQQRTLGFYLGTIIASFYLLTVIDDKGEYQVPSLSVFLLVILTVIDLFLFVSFINHITQSVRFEQLIKNIHQKTVKSLETFERDKNQSDWTASKLNAIIVKARSSNYFQGINLKHLLKYTTEKNISIEFLPLRCTYILKDEPLFKIYADDVPDEKMIDSIFDSIDFYTGQEIDKNYFYGYLHLSEVAVKALSPGINDPNTAVLCIHALTDLFSILLKSDTSLAYCDSANIPRILIPERSFEETFRYVLFPIMDYGWKDRFVLNAMEQLVRQLKMVDEKGTYSRLMEELLSVKQF